MIVPTPEQATAKSIAWMVGELSRNAKDLADRLTRFASDANAGVARGDPRQLMEDMQRLILLATRLDAVQDTYDLFTMKLETPWEE